MSKIYQVILRDSGPNRASIVKLIKEKLDCTSAEALKLSKSGNLVLDSGSELTLEPLTQQLEKLQAVFDVELSDEAIDSETPEATASTAMVKAMTQQAQLVTARYEKQFRDARTKIGNRLHQILDAFDDSREERFELLTAITQWRSLCGKALSPIESMIAAEQAFACDVNNGGMHQYFFNSAGNAWPYVLKILVDGHDAFSESLFRQAISIFPDSSPALDRTERQLQLQSIAETDEKAMWDHFEKHTNHFYTQPYPSEETIWKALQNQPDEEIVPDPENMNPPQTLLDQIEELRKLNE